MTNFGKYKHLATAAVAGLALAGFAAPAVAGDMAGTGTKVEATGGSSASDVRRPVKKYCVLEQRTETRLLTRVCKTAEEWRSLGQEIVER
jgi:hypothetical protein